MSTPIKSKRDILLYVQLGTRSFHGNIYRTKIGIPERGDPYAEWSIASDITRGTVGEYAGAIIDQLEPDLYVGAYKSDLAELGNLEKTASDHLHIVSNKMKELIESISPKKSEFIPVHTSLLAKGRKDPTAAGGGQVIDGAYWLWNCYNWLDLIIEEDSDWAIHPANIQYRDYARGDLPGTPIQSLRSWGGVGPVRGRKLALKPINYETNPFFRIVGISNGLFISPAVAKALENAEMLAGKRDIPVYPFELDTSYPVADPVPAPPDASDPPYRVFGTELLIANYHSWPFPMRNVARNSLEVDKY